MQLRSFTSLVVFIVVVSVAVAFDGVYARQPQTRPAEKSQKPAEPAKEEDPVPVTERSRPAQPLFSDALGPDQFGSFYGPQINNRGDVAFIGRHRSLTAPDGFGQAIFVKTAQGQWKFLRHSDRPTNLNETNFVYGPFSFNDGGDVIATAAFGSRTPVRQPAPDAGAAIQTSAEKNLGIFLKHADAFSNLLQLGQEVPNMPSKFSGFSNPSINTKGTIAFVAAYSDPDGRGLFIMEGGKLRIVARSGQRVSPDSPAVFSEHYYPARINELGEVAFLSRVGVGAGIFVARGNNVELIAIDGKPSPIKGAKYLGFANRAPSINDKGEVVFSGFYDGPTAGRALFYKGVGAAPVKLVLTSSDKTLKYKFTDVMNPEINNRGDIAFIGRLEGRAYGIFVKTAKGIEPVAVTGDVAPGLKAGEEFNNFAQQPSINDNGDIVFYAQLKNANVGIFIKDSKGLRPFVMRGDKLPVSLDAK
jgi:hypothetical protein